MESQWINRQSILSAISNMESRIDWYKDFTADEDTPQLYIDGYVNGLTSGLEQLKLMLSHVYLIANEDKSEPINLLEKIEEAKSLAYKFIHISFELDDTTIRSLRTRGYKITPLADIRNYEQLTRIEWE